MILQSQLEVINNSCRVRVIDRVGDGVVIFDNYKALAIGADGKLGGQLRRDYLDYEVEVLKIVPEINHKRAKELGLQMPLHPEDTPAYTFSDLELRLYYEIIIKKGE